MPPTSAGSSGNCETIPLLMLLYCLPLQRLAQGHPGTAMLRVVIYP